MSPPPLPTAPNTGGAATPYPTGGGGLPMPPVNAMRVSSAPPKSSESDCSDDAPSVKVPAATVSLVQPKHNNLKKKVSSVNDRGPIPKEVKTPSVKVETPSVEVPSVEAPSVETPLVDRTSEVVKPVAEELSAKPKPKKSWFSCCGTKDKEEIDAQKAKGDAPEAKADTNGCCCGKKDKDLDAHKAKGDATLPHPPNPDAATRAAQAKAKDASDKADKPKKERKSKQPAAKTGADQVNSAPRPSSPLVASGGDPEEKEPDDLDRAVELEIPTVSAPTGDLAISAEIPAENLNFRGRAKYKDSSSSDDGEAKNKTQEAAKLYTKLDKINVRIEDPITPRDQMKDLLAARANKELQLYQLTLHLHESEKEYLEKLYKEADTNGDGVLDANEMNSMLRKSGFHFSDDTIVRTLDAAEKNEDGAIEYEEFKPVMQNFITKGKKAQLAAARLMCMNLSAKEMAIKLNEMEDEDRELCLASEDGETLRCCMDAYDHADKLKKMGTVELQLTALEAKHPILRANALACLLGKKEFKEEMRQNLGGT